MLLTQNEYEDLFLFYLNRGYDITNLLIDDKSKSAHLIIAKILFENSPLEANTLYDLITAGSLKEFFDVSHYPPEKFYQGQQLFKGLFDNLDITQYWDSTKYSADQMSQIRLGLEHNVDIAYYNNPLAFTPEEMKVIRLALESAQTKCDDSF